jgi:hypothetical protein
MKTINKFLQDDEENTVLVKLMVQREIASGTDWCCDGGCMFCNHTRITDLRFFYSEEIEITSC